MNTKELHYRIKRTTATGFELVRVAPSDFESDALTTRPNCHCYFFFDCSIISKYNYLDFLEEKSGIYISIPHKNSFYFHKKM